MIRRTKYGSKKTEVNGIKFDSKKEAKRYVELLLLERAGLIRELRLQPRFPFVINGQKFCTYIADFMYYSEKEQCIIVEDVKGYKTEVYKLKSKLFRIMYDQYRFIEF